jgi:hypothetical protein
MGHMGWFQNPSLLIPWQASYRIVKHFSSSRTRLFAGVNIGPVSPFRS